MEQTVNPIIENAANNLSMFPGIGKRSAMRMVLHLIKRPINEVTNLADAIIKLKTDLCICENCNNISQTPICSICSNQARFNGVLCIVENYTDLIAIENTKQYNGLYFVLGGLISAIDGIGPSQLNIEKLQNQIVKKNFKEVLVALSTTIEGDTTLFYLAKLISNYNIPIYTLSRGVSVGAELGYTDEITLANSINHKVIYEL